MDTRYEVQVRWGSFGGFLPAHSPMPSEEDAADLFADILAGKKGKVPDEVRIVKWTPELIVREVPE